SLTGQSPAQPPKPRRQAGEQSAREPEGPLRGCHHHWSAKCASGCLNPSNAAHIRPQDIRDADGAIIVLIVLHHSNQSATNGNAGPVEGMEILWLAVRSAIPRIHSARLKIPADGAR